MRLSSWTSLRRDEAKHLWITLKICKSQEAAVILENFSKLTPIRPYHFQLLSVVWDDLLQLAFCRLVLIAILYRCSQWNRCHALCLLISWRIWQIWFGAALAWVIFAFNWSYDEHWPYFCTVPRPAPPRRPGPPASTRLTGLAMYFYLNGTVGLAINMQDNVIGTLERSM